VEGRLWDPVAVWSTQSGGFAPAKRASAFGSHYCRKKGLRKELQRTHRSNGVKENLVFLLYL
jgi:hypothetical protein